METKNGLLEIKNLLGQATAAAGIAALGGENAAAQLERLNAALEHAAVLSRNTLEQARPCVDFLQEGKPLAPRVDIGGTVRLLDGRWLHIRLDTLLPHCRYQVPAYLSDTITRLLDGFGQSGGKLPYYEKALLVMDEHCSRKTRTVFDQDNKGWKAVPNALKGRLFPDDDQFSLGIALLSTECEKAECNIYVLPAEDAGEFFELRRDGLLF
jgi:hypothetical protein